MSKLCNVQIHINGQETFFLNEITLSTYSEKMRKIVKQERKRTQKKSNNTNNNKIMSIEIDDFPGGPEGFEMVSRQCHNNNGEKPIIKVTNVALLYCCSIFLGMNKDNNLLQKTQTFLEGMSDWSWKELICCLKSCESIFDHVDSNGLLEKLILSLLAKIGQSSDSALLIAALSSSSSSSPETAVATPESLKPRSSSNKSWWFDDLTILPPKIIERVVKSIGVCTNNNNSLTLTKFLLHYLKLASAHRRANNKPKSEFLVLADMAVHGVIIVSDGKKSFSCRSLFWVLRVLSGFGISKELRIGLERLIGEALDESKLDDLLVTGNSSSRVYDVNLVIRLVRVFFNSGNDGVSVQKLRKVGRLIDKYLGEISPDQNLKVSKFLEVAESVPDSARYCFDGVYRAIDIYLESHSSLSSLERSKLCRCLNYQKLSLEACKELSKNPKIPPRITMQALISQQQSKVSTKEFFGDQEHHRPISPLNMDPKMAMHSGYCDDENNISEDVKMNLHRMRSRVVELEKVCREMKGQMSKMVRHNNVFGTPTHSKSFPRLC